MAADTRVEVKRGKNESSTALIRRFTRRAQGLGLVREMREETGCDVELLRVTSRKSDHVLYLRGFEKATIDDIRVIDCSFEAVAKVSEDVMEGVIVAPLGYWRNLSRTGSTANALNPAAYADLGRAPTFSDTRADLAVATDTMAAE